MAHLLAAAVAALLSLGGSGALDFICTESPLKLTFIHPIHGLQCGTSLNASNTGLLTAPSITYSRSLAARNYTVMMLDPDASSHAPRLHWLVVNIPGKFLGGHELAIDGLGTTLSDYTPPRPPPNSGYHRYGFFLLQQPSARQTFAVDLSTQDFNYSAFIQEFNLGPKLESNYMLVSAGTCEIPALPVYTQSVCEGSTLAPGNTCKIRCIPGYAQAKGNYDYKCEASKLSEPEPNCMPCPSDTEQPRVGGTICTSCAEGCSTGNKKAQPRCSCAVPEPESGPEPEPEPEPEDDIACTPCTDEPSPDMRESNTTCAAATGSYLDDHCNSDSAWVSDKTCKASCSAREKGYILQGYTKDHCCVPQPEPEPEPKPLEPEPEPLPQPQPKPQPQPQPELLALARGPQSGASRAMLEEVETVTKTAAAPQAGVDREPYPQAWTFARVEDLADQLRQKEQEVQALRDRLALARNQHARGPDS